MSRVFAVGCRDEDEVRPEHPFREDRVALGYSSPGVALEAALVVWWGRAGWLCVFEGGFLRSK